MAVSTNCAVGRSHHARPTGRLIANCTDPGLSPQAVFPLAAMATLPKHTRLPSTPFPEIMLAVARLASKTRLFPYRITAHSPISQASEDELSLTSTPPRRAVRRSGINL
jgi:hypothetical protein